jgi:hypothetical protein
VVKHKEYYKGKGDGFCRVQVVVSLVSLCMLVVHSCIKNDPSMHWQTCLVVQVCVNIELFFTHANPHLEALAHPLTPEVLRVKECTPTFSSSFVVSLLNSHLSLSRSSGVRQKLNMCSVLLEC